MTATTSATSPRRRGFTLVELLVAMALIVFIMVILTEAFTAGIGVFRTLKSQGDMQERLRAASSLLHDDLRQDPNRQLHFNPIGDPQLSGISVTNPPTKGYFYIQQPASLPEGVDGYNVPSYRMTWHTTFPPSPSRSTASATNRPITSLPASPGHSPRTRPPCRI